MKMKLIGLLAAAVLTVFLTGTNNPSLTPEKTETGKTEPEVLSADVKDISEEEPAQADDTGKAINVKITIGKDSFSVILSDTDAAKAFAQALPATLEMNELNGNEKYCNLDRSLPSDSACPSEIHTGDLMLYGTDCLVLFYADFPTSYHYTPIGRVDAPAGLPDSLGRGSAIVTFEIDS